LEEEMELYDIVMKLTGPVDPIGDSRVDAERQNNLKVLLDLVDKLLTKIDEVATDNKDRMEWSMKQAGQLCSKWQDNEGIRE
jgi:hypothetical protein